MKRLFILFLGLCLVAGMGLAEGQSRVAQKNYYVIDGSYSRSHYFFAKVENIGDKPIYLDTGKLAVFDQNDDIVQTESYILSFPRYLEPGEYAYVRDWGLSDRGFDSVGDVKFSIGMIDLRDTVTRLACEQVYDPGIAVVMYDDYVNVTFTNVTEETLYGINIVIALLDDEGNILYNNYDSLGNIGVHAGSTITARVSIEPDFVRLFEKEGIKLSILDAIVYYENGH